MKFSPGEVVLIWRPEDGIEGEDFSSLHGEEAEITGIITDDAEWDYHIYVPCINHDLIAKEHELRRKDDKDDLPRELTVSWDDCVWSPYKHKETENV